MSLEAIIHDLTDQSGSELPASQPPASSLPPERKAGELVAVMAHDLMEPLCSVTGFLHILQRRYADVLDPEGAELLEWCLQGTADMVGRIEGVMDQARLGSVEPRPEWLDLETAVGRASVALTASINSSGAVIQTVGGARVNADPSLLDLVLRQLLSNAIKFRRDGVGPCVQVSSTNVNGISQMTVADNGIGIEPAYRSRVFDMFVRTDTGRPGFGIGLAQCRAIAERHGGSIRIEDSDLGGAAVVVALGPATW
ncbi:MAG TPA: HAMP domain-containing sensor histidine kinase [Acidimicrobiales bacterium]|nr:HAMP domain-containing sensor histidine kinase [Acidimicrobiales bacterium]